MRLLTAVGGGILGLVLCTAIPMVAWSADKKIYDGPDVEQPGRTIHGKIVEVGKHDAGALKWDVSVENVKTKEVVTLHLDKTTERKEKDSDPVPGDLVIVKYDEKSNRALTFVKDVPNAPEP